MSSKELCMVSDYSKFKFLNKQNLVIAFDWFVGESV